VTEPSGIPRFNEKADPVFFWQVAQWQTATIAGSVSDS
jgi:hypothetical protein